MLRVTPLNLCLNVLDCCLPREPRVKTIMRTWVLTHWILSLRFYFLGRFDSTSSMMLVTVTQQ